VVFVVTVGVVLAVARVGSGQSSDPKTGSSVGTARSFDIPGRTPGMRARAAAAWAATAEREIDLMAITPNYWIGTGDATAASSWSLGHVPGANEHAIADGRSQHPINLNHNLDAAGPEVFITTEDYHGNVGAPGAPFSNFATQTADWIIKGDGDVYLAAPSGAPSLVTDMRSGGTVTLSGASLGSIYNKAGNVVVTTGLHTSSIVHTFSDLSVVTLEDDGDASTVPLKFFAAGGRIVNKKVTHASNNIAIIVLPGALFRQEAELSSSTWLYVASGGRFEYPVATGANVPGAIIDGILDISEATIDPLAFGTLTLGPNRDILDSAVEDFSGYTIDLTKSFPLR
jgi:hypothetical protein